MAGQTLVGRTSFLADNHQTHLLEIIDFIHTPHWKSKTFFEEKYLKNGRSITQIAEETLSSRADIHRVLGISHSLLGFLPLNVECQIF